MTGLNEEYIEKLEGWLKEFKVLTVNKPIVTRCFNPEYFWLCRE